MTANPVADWTDVMALFGLSPPESTPSEVSGGWSHSLWKIDTGAAMYAIKEMREVSGGWWIDQLNAAITFELVAWRDGSVAMAEPMPVAGSNSFLGRLDAGGTYRLYRCHAWVEGEPCLRGAPDVGRSARVGAIVAALARLNVQGGTTADKLAWNALDAYDDTVAEASAKRLDWAPALAELRPLVSNLRADFVELADRGAPMPVLHRDIDPKNTSIRRDGEVVLFDWDYAGPRLVESELLDAALSFAGSGVHTDEDCVFSTIDAYADAGGPPLSFRDAAAPIAEEGFRWIMVNAWRCLGHRGVSPEQEVFAGRVVRELAPRWPASVEAVEYWAGRLEAGDRQ